MTVGADQRYDPYQPGFRDSPHAHLRALQERAPVHRSMGFWVLTRHADVNAVLRDRRFDRGWDRRLEVMGIEGRAGTSAALRMQRLWTLHQDPPDHTRLRALVSKAFTPRTVDALRRRVDVLVDEALDDVPSGAAFDFVTSVAYPLPATIIAELLGLDVDYPTCFATWAADITPTLQPSVSEPALAHADRAIDAFVAYFGEQIDRRRRTPDAGLLSRLIAVEDAGDRLKRDELIGMCAQLCMAGFETTTSALASSVLALIEAPDQAAALRADPALASNAVEELLRFEAPIMTTSRRVREPVELGGHAIAAHEMVLLCLAAANRDPAVHEEPDRLVLARERPRPISFGAGIHHCIGAPLARLELEVALSRLLRRFSRIELASDPVWRDVQALRSLESLPLRVAA